MTGIFYIDLVQTLSRNVHNDYEDNYDWLRFGKVKQKNGTSWRKWFVKQLNKKGFYHQSNSHILSNLSDYPWIKHFEFLFDHLEDDYSKNLLVLIVAFRMLGHKKIKLPLNTPEFWQQIDLIEKNEKKDDFIQINFMDLKLFYNDLSYLQIPVKLYFATAGVHVDFVIKQYELKRDNIYISVVENDIVIDGGGCFGDTALYFSTKAGKNGQVHSFEFIPDNIGIWKKNVSLNPGLLPGITLAPNPLWSSSDVEVYFKSNGPGSTVSFEKFDGYDGIVKTITIDDYVQEQRLKKVDFIKLDIEGAELNALKGAVHTLKNFRPKLAVALYHSPEDFDKIPKFLQELGLGYKFYLSHATIHVEETMLFAISP